MHNQLVILKLGTPPVLLMDADNCDHLVVVTVTVFPFKYEEIERCNFNRSINAMKTHIPRNTRNNLSTLLGSIIATDSMA